MFPEPGVHWRPRDDFWSVTGYIWMAMAFHVLLPTGWIFWTGFVLALKKKTPWFYFASAIPSLAMGWLWPRACWALMGI